MNRSLAHLSALAGVMIALLVSCPTDPPPKQNQPPVAGFTSSPTVQAMTALAFDASASSDPDGDALTYTWAFGDGTRGGTAKIAHVFASAGSYKVTLTMADGKGGNNSLEKTVAVSAGGLLLRESRNCDNVFANRPTASGTGLSSADGRADFRVEEIPSDPRRRALFQRAQD